MIGIAIDRHNKAHLIDYTHHNGNKYAVCGHVYRASEIVNNFQMDGSIPNVCRNCHEAYDAMYIDDLNEALRTARGSLTERRRKRYLEIQSGHGETQHKYWFLAYRESEPLNQYKFLLARNDKSRKYGIGRKHK